MKSIRLSAVLLFLFINFLYAQNDQTCGGMPANGNYKWNSAFNTIEVPFELVGNLVVIPLEINKVKTRFILDTGMPVMGGLLNNSNIAHGLNLNYSGEAKIGGPGGGFSSAKVASGVSFKLGDIDFYDQTFVVMAPSKNLSYFETDGVIGNEILSRFIVEINYDSRTISLTEPENFITPKNAEEISIPFESGAPFISCTATFENGITVPLNMVLDIGASHNLSLVLDAPKNIVLPGKNIRVSTGRGITSELFGYMGRIRKFSIGSYSFDNPLVSFNETKLIPFEKEGNLGSGIMRRFNITFDYMNKRIFIVPNKSFYDPFEFNMAGIQISKTRDGNMTIDRVLPDSPGSKAGLEAKDVLIKINGRGTDEFNKNDLKNVFEDENQVVELQIKRGDVSKTISVKLKRII